jgi:flagellar biosynthesis anti-sigma factor FlgM
MQIHDGNLLGIPQPAAGQAERTERPAVGGAPRSGVEPRAGDAVELSSFAKRINELQDDSALRQARVEQLRNQYLSGRYEIDPVALAQAVVDAHIRG